MNMKITRLARGLKWGGLAFKRLVDSLAAARVHRSANARNPNPHEAVFSMSRRDRKRLVNIAEFSGSEQCLAETRPGGQLRDALRAASFDRFAVLGEVLNDVGPLALARLAPQSQAIGQVDLRRLPGRFLRLDAPGHLFRLFHDKGAVHPEQRL